LANIVNPNLDKRNAGQPSVARPPIEHINIKCGGWGRGIEDLFDKHVKEHSVKEKVLGVEQVARRSKS